MSVNVCWMPYKGRAIGKSQLCDELIKLFGSFPIELDASHVEKLWTVEQVSTQNKAYADLIDAIEKHGRILVTAEY